MHSRDDNNPTYSRATTDTGPTLGLVRKGRDRRRSEDVPSDELWSVDEQAASKQPLLQSLIKTGLGF